MSNQEAEDRGNRELEVPENSVRNPAFEDSPSPSEDSSKGSGSLHGGPGSSESGSTQPPALYGPFRRPENSLPSSSKLVSISSNHQSEKKKRKNLRGVQDSVVSDAAIDAQQQEKERLDRLALKRPTAPTIANYFPVQTDATDVIELSDGSESDDDTPECLGVFYKSQIPNKTPTASEPPSKYTRIDAFRVADRKVAQARQEEQIRLARQNKKKKNDPESVERNAQGRLLINHDRPEEDPDVFVADHLTDVLKPHQLGGIRFLYDNIIETIKDFKDSPGFGCVLAHSMGLGKTLQIIEFVDIFLRTVDAKHVLIITPVNVIQNWLAEFDKWLPTTDEQGRGLRNFGVFLLGDSVKAFDERTNLILKWREQGGVLLMGYDMFRIFVTKQTSKKSAPMSKKVLQSTVPEGIDDDVHIKLRRALLDPGADLVICDEGHKIKCLKTSISNALNQVRTRRRIVLTGYPLQNNLVEYYCMVNFVRPNFLGTKNEFSAMFDRPIRNGQCIDSTRADVKRAQIKIHALVQMVKGFVQRRSSLLLKKILPENKEYVIVVRKTKMQHELYRAFVLFSKVDMYARKSVTYNPLKAHAVGTKIWNHPDLLYLTYMKKMYIVKETTKEIRHIIKETTKEIRHIINNILKRIRDMSSNILKRIRDMANNILKCIFKMVKDILTGFLNKTIKGIPTVSINQIIKDTSKETKDILKGIKDILK
ncbi:hypothetical protein FO519_007655 [Halicephalobus sp. NKZ332]|nr:hypothetical protein FO519_007655 [Halicephalobus sp. NKZ332]